MTAPQTIQSAIDTILGATTLAPLPHTADTLKSGDPERPLTGIVTTFLATADVITRAAQHGANLIITHEPTYYSDHDTDDVAWLDGDPTYDAKRALVESLGMAIWRFHDYWHLMTPDGIQTGVARQLGWPLDDPSIDTREAIRAWSMTRGQDWNAELAGASSSVATIPATTLSQLAEDVRSGLGAAQIRYVGPAELPVRRVALTVGALPGKMTIATLQRDDVDVVLCGETREWETCEYLRDAAYFGRPKGMLVVGHATSEEGGMAYLAEWLRPQLPGVTITHLPSGDPFQTI